MKLLTWNVNSLRVRLPHLLDVLARHAPDVACLQETKCEDATFPAAELSALFVDQSNLANFLAMGRGLHLTGERQFHAQPCELRGHQDHLHKHVAAQPQDRR